MENSAQDIEQRGVEEQPSPGRHRFSRYLRRCRRERRLSLRQVEKLSAAFPERISNSYLAYCETGRLVPSLGKLITLSKVLGIPLQSFTERLEIDRDVVELPEPDTATLADLRASGISRAEKGDLRHAFTCFEKGLELARLSHDAAASSDLMMDMAIVLKRMSRHYTARDLLEDVVSVKGLDGPRMDRALLLLADVLREMGKLPIAAMIGREALHRACRLGDKEKEAHAACLVGNALYDMGSLEEAAPHYERAMRYFRESQCLPPLVCSMSNLANCLVRDARGARFAEGIRMLQEAETIARREGFMRQVADILGYLGQAHGLQGNTARAQRLFFQSNKIAREGEFHDILFSNAWHLRDLALKSGRISEAADHLRSLRYLRARVDNTNPEIREFDRLGRTAGEQETDGEVKA